MFEFVRFKDFGSDELEREERFNALSGYPLYAGQALKLSGESLVFASGTDQVYAICGVSAASSVVTANTRPVVFPVNNRQIWKTVFMTAMTATVNATINKYGVLATAGMFGTSIDAKSIVAKGVHTTAPQPFYFFDVATGSFIVPETGSATSGAYIIFASMGY